MPVHQGGMALAVTSRVLQVTMATSAKRFVRVAETWTYVTRKLECAYTVILVGLDRGTDLSHSVLKGNTLLSYIPWQTAEV